MSIEILAEFCHWIISGRESGSLTSCGPSISDDGVGVGIFGRRLVLEGLCPVNLLLVIIRIVIVCLGIGHGFCPVKSFMKVDGAQIPIDTGYVIGLRRILMDAPQLCTQRAGDSSVKVVIRAKHDIMIGLEHHQSCAGHV